MANEKISITVSQKNEGHIMFLKIIPYKVGGFAVVLPKLIDSNKGRLEKTFVTYKNYGTKLITKRDESEQYSAADIIKFSYHSDGFVQFSSATNNRITSGRNADGTPKGLGILSWPLSNPVSTGPSMTISFWGLNGFTKATPKQIDNRFQFDTDEAIPHPKATFQKDEGIAYAMSFYIILKSVGGNIIDENGRKTANLAMMQRLPGNKAFLRLREKIRVIEVPNENYRIGISWFSIPDKFRPGSGYMFFGPTDGKRGLVATYPAEDYGDKLLMKDLSFTNLTQSDEQS